MKNVYLGFLHLGEKLFVVLLRVSHRGKLENIFLSLSMFNFVQFENLRDCKKPLDTAGVT